MTATLKSAAWIVLTVAVLLGINAIFNYMEGHRAIFSAGYAIRVVLEVGIFIIAAVSLNIVNGFTGQFSIGHAAFFGIGAYSSAALTVYCQRALLGAHYGDDGVGWLHGGLVLLLAMLVGGLAAALAGFVVGLPSLKLRGDYLAIVTLGFGQIVLVVIYANPSLGGSVGFNGNPFNVAVHIPALTSFFWIYLMAAAVIAVAVNLRRSVHGLAMESIREDEVAAEAMGIPTTKLKVFAFVISSFFAGIAGALFVHLNPTSIAPTSIDFGQSMAFVMMIVLGGLGSVTGSVIGAVIVTVLPEMLRFINDYRLVIYPIVLILMMLLRPQGIMGRKELSLAWLNRRRGK